MAVKNLYSETMDVLEHNGVDHNQVIFVAAESYGKFSWEQFAKVAKDTDYDSGFGAQHVATDLIIVGDNWWMERAEYDGSEWWKFRTRPDGNIMPDVTPISLGGEDFAWSSLRVIQEEYEEW